MMAARTSEMLVNFCQTTWRYSPEDSHLHDVCFFIFFMYLMMLFIYIYCIAAHMGEMRCTHHCRKTSIKDGEFDQLND
jgi:hypothetical protein